MEKIIFITLPFLLLFTVSTYSQTLGEFEGKVRISNSDGDSRIELNPFADEAQFRLRDGNNTGILARTGSSGQFLTLENIDLDFDSNHRISLFVNDLNSFISMSGKSSIFSMAGNDGGKVTMDLNSGQYGGEYGRLRLVASSADGYRFVNGDNDFEGSNPPRDTHFPSETEDDIPYDMLTFEDARTGATSTQGTWHIGIASRIEEDGGFGVGDVWDHDRVLTFAIDNGTSTEYRRVFDGNSGSASVISDRRFKTNIREIDRGLDNVLKLVPKSINTRRTSQMLHLVLVLWRKRFKRSILI